MIKTIAIVGSGTMGTGIAQAAALAHFDILLYDVSAEILKGGMERIKDALRKGVSLGQHTATEATEALSRIHPRRVFGDLSEADLVIEAAVEDLEVKKEIFKKLDAIVAPQAVLASNTSTLSVTAIASLTKTPESVVGMHFLSPAPVTKIVEVVRGAQTSNETVKIASSVVTKMKKTPVVCHDIPGFIVNRVSRPLYGEALRLLGEQVATVEEIDRIMRVGGGFAMGPFELMDAVGIDVNLAITQSIFEQFSGEPRFRPHRIERQMVQAGMLGRKTKRGFYTYK
jgi:3-hydroxybutyryl-CoA dehydrogenase